MLPPGQFLLISQFLKAAQRLCVLLWLHGAGKAHAAILLALAGIWRGSAETIYYRHACIRGRGGGVVVWAEAMFEMPLLDG